MGTSYASYGNDPFVISTICFFDAPHFLISFLDPPFLFIFPIVYIIVTIKYKYIYLVYCWENLF